MVQLVMIKKERKNYEKGKSMKRKVWTSKERECHHEYICDLLIERKGEKFN